MTNDRKNAKGKTPSRYEKKESCLEGMLNQKITLNTDLADFFVIVGWDAYGFRSSLYKKGGKKLQDEIYQYAVEGGKGVPASKRSLRTRAYNSIIQTYERKIKTLGNLKRFIESNGLRHRNLGYQSFACFNEALKNYGIKPFKIGGILSKYPAEIRKMRRYGLEPAKKDY